MKYRVNYNRLENLKQFKYYIYIITFIIIIIILFILSVLIRIKVTINTYGVYKDNKLLVKINEKLSDEVLKSSSLLFKDELINYNVDSIVNIEVFDNEIVKELSLTIDKKLISNDYGKVTIIVGEKRIIKYIFDLFK